MKSKFKDVPLIYDEGLPHYVLKKARTYGNKIAMIDGPTERICTFSDFVTSVSSLSAALFHRGMRKGNVALTFLPNIMEYPIIFHGILSTGATVATCNPTYNVDEILYEMNDCKCNFVFTVPEALDIVTAASKQYGRLLTVFVVGQSPGFTSFQDLLQEGSTLPFPAKVQFDPKEDVAVIAYSSGTTGLPKGVMLTHFGSISLMAILRSKEVGMYNEHNTSVAFLPFFHLYGVGISLCMNFAAGDTLILQPRFDLVQYLEYIQKYKCTFVHVVPPIAILLAKSPLTEKYNVSSVRDILCGAAPLSPEVAQLLHQKFPKVPRIRQGYGMTECVTHMGVSTEPYGNCGKILPNTEVKIIDTETGRELGVGQAGELLLKGPQIMKGYLNRPKETAETIDKDGFVHSGDVGKYDSEGNFFIVDRIKELVKFKGFQVPPAELEAVLLTHPGVAEAAVIGLQDLEAGELPLAFVVKTPGSNVTAEEIRLYVDGKVSYYKRLRGGVRFINEIPKAGTGKMMRRPLRDMANKAEKSKL